MPSDIELQILQIVTIISALLSLVGGIYLAGSILNDRPFMRKSRADEKILFSMALVSIIASFAFVETQSMLSNDVLCQIQATVINFTVSCLPFLNVAQSFNFWYILSGRKQFDHLFWYLITICVSVPMTFAFYALGAGAYGPAKLWCWILAKEATLRYALFYGPLWLCIFLGILFTSLGVSKVYNVEKKIVSGVSKYRHTRTASKAYIFGLIFVIVWIPGTVNRITEIVNGSSPFILMLLHVMFTPLQGFLNALAYFWFKRSREGKTSSDHKSEKTSSSNV